MSRMMTYGRLLLCWLVLMLAPAVQAQDWPAQLQARLQAVATEPQQVNPGLNQALHDFYAQAQFAPLWRPEARRAQLAQALAGLESDGLNPEDYQLSRLRQNWQGLSPEQQLAQELLASRAYLLALLHVYRGKVSPETLDPHWNFASHLPDIPQGLQAAREAAEQGRLAAVFSQARPPSPQYGRLQAALAKLRLQAAQGGWAALPAGPTLRLGMVDARVALLRERLRQEGWLEEASPAPAERFDEALAEALQRYQAASYLEADGALGPATLSRLNTPLAARIDQLRVNLERARWLLRDMPENYVLVDVAGYKIAYYRGGQAIWRSRVQVGKPYRSTPIFQSRITYITLNPTWTVPPTILREDLIPKVRKDPAYLARNRMSVIDHQGQVLADSELGRPGTLVRQRAGEGNALGRLAIRFPNPYAVYLHDTPHQGLFDQEQRAFSSGCIRVERALELAELLFDDAAQWSQEGIRQALAEGDTRNVTLKTPLPIYLAYWTVDVREGQPPAFKPDIYERDAPLLKALDTALQY